MNILILWCVLTTIIGACWYINNLLEGLDKLSENRVLFKHAHVELWDFLEYEHINTAGKIIAETLLTIIFLPSFILAYTTCALCICCKYVWRWFKITFSRKNNDDN